jgi:hypothetical protein
MPRIWRAEWDGECGLCDDPLHEGDECVNIDGEVVHADCAEENDYEVERS